MTNGGPFLETRTLPLYVFGRPLKQISAVYRPLSRISIAQIGTKTIARAPQVSISSHAPISPFEQSWNPPADLAQHILRLYFNP